VPCFISAVIACAFTASGNSRTPFILNTIGLVCNVILDPICILVLDLGIRGAALATILSQFLVFTLLIIGITCFKHRPFAMHALRLRPDKKKLLKILKWSVPIGLESIFFCFLTMLSTRIEARFGANAMAVGKIGSQIESLSWLIGGGFGSALVIFVGQNYGAGRQDRIQQGVRISSSIMAAWGILVTAFLCFAGHWVFSIFLPDPEIARLGRYYCYIFALCQLPMNLEAVWSGAFKGTGRTVPPSLVSMASNTLKPILALILSQTSLGLYGIWVGVSGADAIRGIWILIWYRVSEAKQNNSVVQ
jgi:putative MATE family efflux protein